MRHRLIAAAAAVFACLATATVAAPAHADIPDGCLPQLTVTPLSFAETLTGRVLSIGVTKSTRTFGVQLSQPVGTFNNCPTVTRWQFEAGDNVNGDGDRDLYLHVRSTSPVVTIDPAGLPNSDSGKPYQVVLSGRADGTYFSDVTTLTIRRSTRFNPGLVAAPDPAAEGATITMHATLQRANWEALKWQGYGDRRLAYQNKPATGGPWTTRSTPRAILTASSGFASASTHANLDRYHRFVYNGSTIAGASASASDLVHVTH